MARTRAKGLQNADKKPTTHRDSLKFAGKKRSRDDVESENTSAQYQDPTTSNTKKRKAKSSKPPNDSIKRTTDKILAKYGSLPLSDLGLPNPSSPEPESVLALIFNAMLTSARISHELAFKSVKCLIEAGYQDIKALTRSTWEERTEVLTKGGYTRYREKTATALGDLAQFVEEKYDGDLNNLLSQAKSDPTRVRESVREIKGIGNVGVDIFCNTAQGIWPCLTPFIDPRSMKTANQCGIGDDVHALWEVVGKEEGQMCRLASALTTIRLEKKEEEFA